jgi:hypothetical protein
MKNKAVIIIAVVVLLIGVVFIINKNKGSSSQKASTKPTPEEVLPTVDASVQVDLVPITGKKEMLLKISSIPASTQTIDYELSYATAEQGLQGIIGTISISGDKNYEKQLTLGTCSSGKCVYHQVVGKIKVVLKFSGDYGERIFEKEYEI